LGDGIIFFGEKINYYNINKKIRYLIRNIPGEKYYVFLGDGQGLDALLSVLDNPINDNQRGIQFGLVEERGSTKEPVRGPMLSYFRDKDLLAALTIAVRGGYSGLYEPLWIR
jgi:hypothetical protein